MFRCLAEDLCIHPEDVCDGHVHCRLAMDDEKYCTQKSLQALGKSVGKHKHLAASPNPYHTRVLNLQYKNIQQIDPDDILLDSLVIVIYLDHNVITIVPALAFRSYPRLQYLHLSHNEIERLLPFAFESVSSLQILELSYNKMAALSSNSFDGSMSIRSLDLSYNFLIHIDETLFVHFGSIGIVYHTDALVCCMVPSDVSCEVDGPADQCYDLLLHPYLTYTVCGVGTVHLVSNAIAVLVHLIDHKNVLLLTLPLSDALFACHLLIIAASDMFYRNVFSFYAYTWTESVPCYISMLAFFLSFQQGLFTILLVMVHTYTLIGFPFRHSLHRRIIYVGAVVWLLAVLQLAVVVFVVSIWDTQLVAYNHLCQLPSLPAFMDYPLNISLCVVYGLCVLAVCAIVCGIVRLVKQSMKQVSAHSARTNVKVKVMKKSVVVVIVNAIGFVSVLITEGLVRSGVKVEPRILLLLTITVMSINKLCNPWLYSLSMIQNMIGGKKKTQQKKKP
jgi:Leucine-rich repeat (LRR) protein